MSTTLDAAKALLLSAFVKYVDWDDDAHCPYPVALGTKQEADPRDLVEVPPTTFPCVTVQVDNPKPGRKLGLQQELIYNVRVSVIYHAAASEQPDTALQTLTGEIIWNIMQTKGELGSWLNLDWVSDITHYTPLPANNELSQFLRMRSQDQDADGGQFVASQTDFAVVAWEV